MDKEEVLKKKRIKFEDLWNAVYKPLYKPKEARMYNIGEEKLMSHDMVFICSPFSNANPDKFKENVEFAKKFCRYAMLWGKIPFAPHLYFPKFLNDGTKDEREIGITCGLSILERCKELWLCLDKPVSIGMRIELGRAERQGIPITYITEELIIDVNSQKLRTNFYTLITNKELLYESTED